MTEPLATILAELKARLTELYGERLVHVILYGSRARGDALPDSDIDILVVLKGETSDYLEMDRISYITSPLGIKHSALISTLVVSEGEYEQHKDWSFLTNVRQEGIAL